MGRAVAIFVGLAIVVAVGMWDLSDGGEASAGVIIVGVIAMVVAFVGTTLWSRRT